MPAKFAGSFPRSIVKLYKQLNILFKFENKTDEQVVLVKYISINNTPCLSFLVAKKRITKNWKR